MKPATPAQSDLWLAADFALLHAQLEATASHAHFAHQLIYSPGAPVTVRTAAGATSAETVLVASMVKHEVAAMPAPAFVVFAEPVALSTETLLATIETSQPTAAALVEALSAAQRSRVADERVERALSEIDVMLDEKIDATELARRAHVSLSQLERLFGRHLGVPVRRLVLWRRLRLALASALSGRSLTDAAHQAGFADSAHFSRTMRSLFGVRADQTLAGMRLNLVGTGLSSVRP